MRKTIIFNELTIGSMFNPVSSRAQVASICEKLKANFNLNEWIFEIQYLMDAWRPGNSSRMEIVTCHKAI